MGSIGKRRRGKCIMRREGAGKGEQEWVRKRTVERGTYYPTACAHRVRPAFVRTLGWLLADMMTYNVKRRQ